MSVAVWREMRGLIMEVRCQWNLNINSSRLELKALLVLGLGTIDA